MVICIITFVFVTFAGVENGQEEKVIAIARKHQLRQKATGEVVLTRPPCAWWRRSSTIWVLRFQFSTLLSSQSIEKTVTLPSTGSSGSLLNLSNSQTLQVTLIAFIGACLVFLMYGTSCYSITCKKKRTKRKTNLTIFFETFLLCFT